MNKIKFAKFVSSGNDFVIINNYDKKIHPRKYSDLAKILCQPKFGIGADGFLIIEPPSKKNCEFKMVYYNSDGSYAAMCGNGARCIAYYAYELELCDEVVNFETGSGILKGIINYKRKSVKIKVPDPKDLRLNIILKLENNREINVDFINTGVPHTVLFVDDIDKIDAYNLGKAIRYHKEFTPDGTNVNFVKVKDDHTIYIRTYERGVENETLSCGTGALASSIISAIKNFVKPPVKCITKSQDILNVTFKKNPPEDMLSPVSEVYLEGKVKFVFEGVFYL
ncbi:MAG: diaminopimelate epimerase [Elusimicrobiota bacterium]|nr:diaminopimelate epimerase [Endomicrobiia bacterium]MCX7910609.1 diaminopimelate epimerase [Endomicrobiia bacterium]MDW8166232.1 diaminopimelate epimerase [Elusimicrobiota bacterium]